MDNFAGFFEQRGFRCHTPAYRYHDDLRSEQSAKLLTGLSIADYVEDVAECVKSFSSPPILVGHSLGGLIAQKLGARGLAKALVLLNKQRHLGHSSDHRARTLSRQTAHVRQ